MRSSASRGDRRHRLAESDQREIFERDRDRILYCSAFRRLSGVTQIVRAGEADVFHTRLAHSLKVAQLGRRIAQNKLRTQEAEANQFGLHPEVVEAACLAHDLGHPPFGHAGEKVLNRLVEKYGDPEGYEGNAQSFRVITKLSVRFEEEDGLDLSRATLNATLKYPWIRDSQDPKKSKKWSVYSSEDADFQFARELTDGERKSLEAELMDWSDDIAYSVHDLEDFHRCQVLPWYKIFSAADREKLVSRALEAWPGNPSDAAGRLRTAHDNLAELFEQLVPALIKEPYEGTKEQRRQIRFITSRLIGRYIDAITINKAAVDPAVPFVSINSEEHDEVRILKQITREYIIGNPTLAAQQRGHERVLTELFEDILEDSNHSPPRFLPRRFAHLFDDLEARNTTKPRAVADCVATLTEAEAVALHGRLRGYASGSVLDPIVR